MSSFDSADLIKVLVVEDHTIVRQGLVALLSTSERIKVVADLNDGLSASKYIEQSEVDLLLTDLALPGLGGIELIQKASSLGIRSLALSMHHDAIWVQRALEAGAWGYLLKGSGINDLLTAICTIADGERYLSPSVKAVNTELGLTTREKEVLTLVAQGHTSKEISSFLSISTRTVEHHRANMMDKLKIHDIAGLTRYAIRNAFIDPRFK